jgi:phage baseplate assembly protein W
MSYDLKIINGDLAISNGSLTTVENSDKLIQDILKIALTAAGSNPIHPWYGSYISRTLVGNPNYNGIIIQIAKSQLTTALENLKSLQGLQVKSFQPMTADEQIASISDISVMQSQVDPRLFDVVIRVLSKGLKPITTSFTVSTL